MPPRSRGGGARPPATNWALSRLRLRLAEAHCRMTLPAREELEQWNNGTLEQAVLLRCSTVRLFQCPTALLALDNASRGRARRAGELHE